jgi:hypothetical protein
MKKSEPIDFEYDVAISFAGEDREVAFRIAELLTRESVQVFYDKYEDAELWGKDLYTHLAEVYSEKARFCLVLISEYYSKKLWTKHELQNAFARAFKENEEYILPLKLDDTTIPGIPATIGYHDLRNSSVERVAELILKKLGKFGSKASSDRKSSSDPKIIDVQKIPLPRTRREFSDRDRSVFLVDSFHGIISYFAEGLAAMKQHDSAIETEMSQITNQKYVFELYRAGTLKSACKIWIGSSGSQKNISFREGDFDPNDDSSVNEWIYVEADEIQMYLKGIFGEFGSRLPDKLRAEDAATALWKRFIRPLDY